MCDESIRNFEDAAVLRYSRVFNSSDMAPLFDDDIQSMFGLIIGYIVRCHSPESHNKWTESRNQEPVRMHVIAMTFAHFKNYAFHFVMMMKERALIPMHCAVYWLHATQCTCLKYSHVYFRYTFILVNSGSKFPLWQSRLARTECVEQHWDELPAGDLQTFEAAPS